MKDNKRIYALGFFDGVHLGHQTLLAECVRLAAKKDAQAAAITFDRHPQALFLDQPPKLLTTAEERQLLLRQYGVGPIYTYPVTKEVMSTPWEKFLEELMEYGAVGFVCGDDFRFGHRGEGSAEKLQVFCRERQLPCVIVPQQELDGIRISSTHIRALLERGDMEEAVRFLGHPHLISGTVMTGRHLGRTIGVPTANLWLSEEIVTPRLGVYACRCSMEGKTYAAVTNVGSRPTVGGHRITVEAWILDFEGDLYGQTLTLAFYKFLRPEQKFDSLVQLRAEIHRNAETTRKYFAVDGE